MHQFDAFNGYFIVNIKR